MILCHLLGDVVNDFLGVEKDFAVQDEFSTGLGTVSNTQYPLCLTVKSTQGQRSLPQT